MNRTLPTRKSMSEDPQPGQFLVYLADVRTDILLDPQTGAIARQSPRIPTFNSFEDAAEYAEQAVRRFPKARADIYDHTGRAGDSLKRIYPPELRRRYDPRRRARRDTWLGGTLLALFAIWSVTAATRSDMHFLWFYIVGMKLLVVGTVFFVRGVGWFLDNRRS